jgi:hypothetical protein
VSPLYLIIPVAILVTLITIIGFLFLRGIEDTRQQNSTNGGYSTTNGDAVSPSIVHHRGEIITYSNNHLTKWINLAWENTWTNQIQRFYWEADRKVRDFLRKKGWNCS